MPLATCHAHSAPQTDFLSSFASQRTQHRGRGSQASAANSLFGRSGGAAPEPSIDLTMDEEEEEAEEEEDDDDNDDDTASVASSVATTRTTGSRRSRFR